MDEKIETVYFKSHSQKPKSTIIYKNECDISKNNINIKFKDNDFNCKIQLKYNVQLEILYSLEYDDEMFHFIGIKMNQIEKKNKLPKDSEINKKEFWWENIYDKNYSLNVGDIVIIRYNENGHLDNMSVEDYNVLEKLIIQPEDLNSDDTDSRTSVDFESTDDDYNPDSDNYNYDDEDDNDNEEDEEEEEDEEDDNEDDDDNNGNLILED